MRYSHLLSAICATSLLFSIPSHAAPVDFNFATPGSTGLLGTTATNNGITATSFYESSGNWVAAPLYRRNSTNEHGLGVCSEGQSACDTGGGDVNELSNQLGYQEVILLDKGGNASWVSLWVSSLDNSEVGTLYWGNSNNIDTLLAGNHFSYDTTDFGTSVEGDILTLSAASGFNAMAQYVLFTPGGGIAPATLCISSCTPPADNDYLVWKGTVNAVPVPAAVWLFGSGLLGLVGIARRKKA